MVHGPSNQGKSALILGLLASFVQKQHFGAFIDAEGTTPAKWARELMGPSFDSPLFRAMYPTTYEGTVDNVRAWCELVGNLREKGKVDKDTTGLIGLDSIRKLVPKRLLEKLTKEGSEGSDDEQSGGRGRKSPAGIDGMNGAAARYKANLNSAWMDELTLLLRQTGTGMVVIGREYSNGNKSSNPFSNEPDYLLGGGQGLVFEGNLTVRVVHAYPLHDAEKKLIGYEHVCEVRKTKIGGKTRRTPVFKFHTMAGDGAGFDRARDVFDLAVEKKVIEQKGAHFSFGDVKLGQGEEKAIAALREGSGLAPPFEGASVLDRIEGELRKGFRKPEQVPEEVVFDRSDTSKARRKKS
jgi:recombination protein RecA